jgi:hypothetical protein
LPKLRRDDTSGKQGPCTVPGQCSGPIQLELDRGSLFLLRMGSSGLAVKGFGLKHDETLVEVIGT